MKTASPAAYFWMLGSAVAFTAMATIAHSLAGLCPWPVVALARTLLALLFAVVLVMRAGVPFAVWKPKSLWMRSLAGSFSLVLTFYALPRLPIAATITLTNMSPIWIALLSWPMLGHRPPVAVWLAACLGVFGVYLMQHPETTLDTLAAYAAVLASLSTAFAMMGLHRVRNLDARAIVVHFSAVGSIFALGACLFESGGKLPAPPSNPLVWMALLGVGVTATIGQLFMTRAYSLAPPANVAVVGLSQVVFSFLADVIFWGRAFEPFELLGMILIVVPTAWLLSFRR